MKEKKFDKQKLLTTAVTVILLFFFVGGFMIGLDRVQSMEGTFPPNEIKEGISEAPADAEDAERYLEKVIEKALKNNPSLSYDDYFSIDSGSLVTDGSEAFNSTLLFALDSFEGHISSVEENSSLLTNVDYGENISSLLRVPSFEYMKAMDFNCSYIYYSCPSCGETSDEPLTECVLCGSLREYFIKYRDEYEIELVLAEAPGAMGQGIDENFSLRTEKEISALTSQVFDDTLIINDTNVKYNKFKIIYKVNRLTDEITSLRYIKEMSVTSDVTFTGKFQQLGEKKISFNITETDNFSFTWPSLSLNEEILVIEPKKSDNLLATLTCVDPLSMTVNWTSSDESVATVDSEGYIHTTKNTGETVITATFDFLGKTYSDSCTVYVRVPVESMKMMKRDVTLAKGEQVTLKTKVSPSSATLQTVKWYSEDESIATVDENGVVTAVAQGEVIVYALSDDGYFRSTCEVTVE